VNAAPPDSGDRGVGAEGRSLIVDGLDIYLRDEGQGSPLLLLHGFPFTHHSFRAVLEPLARRHRVLALDLPGFGNSARPPAFAYDVVAYADAMAALLRQVGAAPAAAIAHGFGAAVAVAMAVLQPGTLCRLVLVSPTIHAQPLSILARLASRDGLIGAWLFRRAFTRERLARRLRRDVYRDPATADDELVDRVWEPLRRPGGLDAARRVVGTMASLDAIAELPPRLACPSLVVSGEDDRIVSPRRARLLAAEIPGSRAVTVAACGHCPHEERPAEFLEAVMPFLDEERG